MMINWKHIDTVLFDMDGTLLDLHFDSYFWKKLVPQRFGEKEGISLDEVWGIVGPKLKQVSGTLERYCFDYWTKELGMDILAMKREVTRKIHFRPNAQKLLAALKGAEKQVVMATNTDRDGLNLKMEFLPFGQYFDAIYSAHDFGYPKEEQAFWENLVKACPFDPNRTLFIDDNLEVLRSARTYGITNLLAVSRPDLSLPEADTREFQAIDNLGDLLPIK